jgi:prolyl-tRNA editing enzyme YbaK/EbsC (Cys-tRNA(Pro) deacylase)
MDDLKAACRRVEAGARALGLEISVLQMTQSTRSAEEAAAACGCDVAQIVKSLVFRGKSSGRSIMLLVSGANRVDERGVAASIGEGVRRPDAQYVRDVTGYAIGGIPPFAHAELLATFMDEDLLAHATVWAAAGTPESVFEIAPGRLADAVKARVIRVKSA